MLVTCVDVAEKNDSVPLRMKHTAQYDWQGLDQVLVWLGVMSHTLRALVAMFVSASALACLWTLTYVC